MEIIWNFLILGHVRVNVRIVKLESTKIHRPSICEPGGSSVKKLQLETWSINSW
jgi:hypothetical protein